MSSVAALGRLTGAIFTLIRQDALLPRELDGLYPPALRILSRAQRLLGGPKARQGRPGERLARALEGMGPVAIKLGQLLSTRADIFGITFAEDLSRLKDRLPAFSTEVARRAVEQSLGRPLSDLFFNFGEPVAAASLAQAHEALLLDGRRVAVKVLRPGVERRVAEDGEVLALAGQIVEFWAPSLRRLEPRKLTETVIRATELELDLRLEAAGADELREVTARDGYMSVPKVVWDGVGKRVLTLEWAQGTALSDPAALTLPGIDRKAMADNLIRAFLVQALDHGVFHADLHEGNLFVSAPDQVVAVDFGIVGRLGPMERRYLAEILWGFLNRDYERVAQIHFEAGYVPRSHSVSAFAQALRAVGEPVFGRPASDVPMSRVLLQLFEITALFDMHLRPELVLLQKTMMTVEGVTRRIYPDHDIWAASDPVVRRWMLRELSPQARVQRYVTEGLEALRAIHRLVDQSTQTPATPADHAHPAILWFAIGAATAGLAFVAASLFS